MSLIISVTIHLVPNDSVICAQVRDHRLLRIPLCPLPAGAYTVGVDRDYWGGGKIGSTEFQVADLHDSDGDGVPDQLDKCPDTRPNVSTGGNGCESGYDINGDGKTGIEEAIHIIQVVAGLRPEQPRQV